MSFSSFKLHPLLERAVGVLGFKGPTPIQAQAIPPALEGRDILGCAQTGSGKTVAFALPILQRLLANDPGGLRALVLVPTRELAVQVERTFKDLGRFTSFKTAVVIGGVSHSGQTRSVQGGATILVATPGRLLDHLRQGNFSLKYVEHLVLDEADRMLDMGFLPEIKAVISQMPADRQTQLFSATLHANVESIAAFATRNPLRVEIARPSTVAEGISQILYPVIQSQKTGLLITLLKTTEMRSVLVFTRTKHGADKVASRLKDEGYKVGTLHSNRSQNQRQQAMEDFRQLRIQILVATDIAARGIDVKNISHVVNFDVPRFPEDYVHRVGRTARAYGVGDALLLVDPQEEPFVKGIEKFIQVTFPRATVPNFQYNNPPRGQAFTYLVNRKKSVPSSQQRFSKQFQPRGNFQSRGNFPPRGPRPIRNFNEKKEGGTPSSQTHNKSDSFGNSVSGAMQKPASLAKFSWGRKPKPAGGLHSKFWGNKKKSFHGGPKKGSWGQKPRSPEGFSSDRSKPGNRPPEKQGFIGYFRKKFRKG